MCLCSHLVEAKGAACIDLLTELGEGCSSCSELSLGNFLDSAGNVSKYLPGGTGKTRVLRKITIWLWSVKPLAAGFSLPPCFKWRCLDVFFMVQPVQDAVDELGNVRILYENLCNYLSELSGRSTCLFFIKYTWFNFPLLYMHKL